MNTMKKLSLNKKDKALVLVAHPDDETIWMGGTLLQNKQASWTIFSLCRKSDNDRRPKFNNVCALYGARSIITDLDDEDMLGIEQTIPMIEELVMENIKNEDFDYIFTHGSNGEYGHPRHIGVYKAVKNLIKSKKINIKKVLCFNYTKYRETEGGLIDMRIKPDSDFMLELSEDEMSKKKKIIAEMYGYPYTGIDVSLCTNPEGFKVLEI